MTYRQTSTSLVQTFFNKLLGGATDAIIYKVENPNVSGLELSSRITANVGFNAAFTAVGLGIGGPPGAIVGFGLAVTYDVFEPQINGGLKAIGDFFSPTPVY